MAVVTRPERFRRQSFTEVMTQGGETHVDIGDSIAAIVTVIRVCRPVSISGCHFAGAGTPYSASIPETAP